MSEKFEIISQKAKDSQLGQWFYDSNIDHFWVRRRFEVFKKLLERNLTNISTVADFGCGHGLMQVLCQKELGWNVDGFDLDEAALQGSLAVQQKKFLYDVFDKHPRFLGRYDLIILFDVLEHVEHEIDFLQAILAHLKNGGFLALNVPARAWLFSAYDQANRHFRRYSQKSLAALKRSLPVVQVGFTEWGTPYLPLLLCRKVLVAQAKSPDQALRDGFRVGSPLVNHLLAGLGKMEKIPHHFPGTSLMSLWKKTDES